MTTTNLWNYIIIGQPFWQWQNQNKQIVLLIHRCVFCNARVWHQEWNVKWRNVSDRSKTNPHKRGQMDSTTEIGIHTSHNVLTGKERSFCFARPFVVVVVGFFFGATWTHFLTQNNASRTEWCKTIDFRFATGIFGRHPPIVFGHQFLCRSSFFFSQSFFFSRQFSCDIFTPLVILSFHFVIVECFSGEFLYFLPLSFALLLSLGNVTLVSFYSIQFHSVMPWKANRNWWISRGQWTLYHCIIVQQR